MKFFVYGLFDLLEPEVIRYVGAASKEGRPLAHVREALSPKKNTHKLNWIRSLGERGYGWRVLQECASWDETMAAEKAYVAEWRGRIGQKLTNSTGGGEGFFAPTPEVKARRAAAIRAAAKRPETKARHSAASKARLAVAGNLAKWQAGRAAAYADPEKKASILASIARRNARPKYRAAHSAGLRRAYSDPAARKRLSDALHTAWENDPDRNSRQAKVARRLWEDPEWRRRHQLAVSNPEHVTRHREATRRAMLAWWSSPGVKAKMSLAAKKRMAAIAPEELSRRVRKAWHTRKSNRLVPREGAEVHGGTNDYGMELADDRATEVGENRKGGGA